MVYFPFANYSSHFLLDILWSKFHCISSVLLCLIEWVYPTVFKISNFLVAKLHIIIWVILSVFCGSGIFRSLNKGWEFIFLSWVPVSKLFCILVGDFRCPSVPPIIISRASRRTMIWERRFCIGSEDLASGLGHLCACGKSRGIPGSQVNNSSLACHKDQRKHWM